MKPIKDKFGIEVGEYISLRPSLDAYATFGVTFRVGYSVELHLKDRIQPISNNIAWNIKLDCKDSIAYT